jgi:hypothetical protein
LRQGVEKGRPRRSRKNGGVMPLTAKVGVLRVFPSIQALRHWMVADEAEPLKHLASHWALALPLGHLETTGPKFYCPPITNPKKAAYLTALQMSEHICSSLVFYNNQTNPIPNKNTPIAFYIY